MTARERRIGEAIVEFFRSEYKCDGGVEFEHNADEDWFVCGNNLDLNISALARKIFEIGP